MDPIETLRLINESGCMQAARDLAEWIAKGGFMPHVEGDPIPNVEDWVEQHDRELIAALRVAIAYGDLSGLVGCGYEVQR